MKLSSNQFIFSISCILPLVSTSYAEYGHQDRELWNFPKAFDFYNKQCQETSAPPGSQDFYNNPCPQCSDESFPHFHCNSCCAGGASSMKMAWHGCKGNLTFSIEGIDRCGTTDTSQADKENTELKFIDCECYDQVIKGGSNDFTICNLTDSISAFDGGNDQMAQDTGGDPLALICIVSTYQDVGIDQFIVNLAQELPNPLGIKQSVDTVDSTTGINEQLSVTFFDTSCESAGNDSIHPLYPGFGKAPGSCPGVGFVDMYGKMPLEMDAYNGIPSHESWFEFLDGTSTSFSPSEEDYHTDIHFEFTFATCACIENVTMYPSTTPPKSPSNLPIELVSSSPSKYPSSIPAKIPGISPIAAEPVSAPAILPIFDGGAQDNVCGEINDLVEPMCDCQNGELDECINFATSYCVGNGLYSSFDEVCPIRKYLYGAENQISSNMRPNQRLLEEVEKVVKLVEQNRTAVLTKHTKFTNLTWIQEQITYHKTKLVLHKINEV